METRPLDFGIGGPRCSVISDSPSSPSDSISLFRGRPRPRLATPFFGGRPLPRLTGGSLRRDTTDAVWRGLLGAAGGSSSSSSRDRLTDPVAESDGVGRFRIGGAIEGLETVGSRMGTCGEEDGRGAGAGGSGESDGTGSSDTYIPGSSIGGGEDGIGGAGFLGDVLVGAAGCLPCALADRTGAVPDGPRGLYSLAVLKSTPP